MNQSRRLLISGKCAGRSIRAPRSAAQTQTPFRLTVRKLFVPFGIAALATVALLLPRLSTAVENSLEPKIGPGYRPQPARDEQGIWMELEDYEKAIRQSALLVVEPQIADYVYDVACRVTGDYCPDLRFYVIRNPGFNASMTPNGVMQIWTGLLVRVASEDELAAVLGHELAHYTQLHTLELVRSAQKKISAGTVFDIGIILLTGYNIPVGNMLAAASLMSFSRDNETEADLLGVKFMASAGYDPWAASRVWEGVVYEEQTAVAKRDKPGMFGQTHPASEQRIIELRQFAAAVDAGKADQPDGENRHVQMLNSAYMTLMEDQLDTNRFGRTLAMLETHRRIGVREQLVSFFQGEMYRQRAADGDMEQAEAAYEAATQGEYPVAQAHLNLGYLYLKQRMMAQAREHFREYLALEPNADDRAMIEFYLK